MNSTISRTPSVETRKKLRKEVHFGCPVKGCGSPYLSWHHFDPSWNIDRRHNPNGMIALCLQHHKEADQGAFTVQQLRDMKKQPFLEKREDFPKGRFNWKREQLLLLAGGNWYIGSEVILNVKGKNIIWLSKDKEGFEELNLDIYDSNGAILLSMRDNDWLIHAPFDDLECPPSANSLKLRAISHDIWINLRFSQLSKSELYGEVKSLSSRVYQDIRGYMRRTWPQNDWTERILDSIEFKEEQARKNFELINEKIEDETITLCTIEGHLIWPLNISLDKAKTILPGQNIIAGNFMVSCGVGVRIT